MKSVLLYALVASAGYGAGWLHCWIRYGRAEYAKRRVIADSWHALGFERGRRAAERARKRNAERDGEPRGA